VYVPRSWSQCVCQGIRVRPQGTIALDKEVNRIDNDEQLISPQEPKFRVPEASRCTCSSRYHFIRSTHTCMHRARVLIIGRRVLLQISIPQNAALQRHLTPPQTSSHLWVRKEGKESKDEEAVQNTASGAFPFIAQVGSDRDFTVASVFCRLVDAYLSKTVAHESCLRSEVRSTTDMSFWAPQCCPCM